MKSWLFICDDERRAALKPLCEEGLSVPEIARRLGTYKGSVSNYLSAHARDLRALRSERAAARLDDVVADGRAKMTIVREPASAVAPEPDRIAWLESSVAALTATVGEVLDVVRGIAAQLADLPPARPQPSAMNGDHDASHSLVNPLRSARRGRTGGRPARPGAGSAALAAQAAPVTPSFQSLDARSAEAPDAADAARSRGTAGRGGEEGAEEQPAASVADPVPADLPARREDRLIEGDAPEPAEDDDGRWAFGPGGWKLVGEWLEAAPEAAPDHAEPASEACKEVIVPAVVSQNPAADEAPAPPAEQSQKTERPLGLGPDLTDDAGNVWGVGPGGWYIVRRAPVKGKGGRKVSAWPEERVAIVRQMAADLKSDAEIAAHLGVSKSAIIGLRARHNIRSGGPGQDWNKVAAKRWENKPAPAPKVEKSSPAPRRAGNISIFARPKNLDIRGTPAPLPRSAPSARPARPKTLPALVTATPVGLLDLTGKQCRFAVGESPDVIGRHLFCAADTGDVTESYCAHHRFRCTSGAVYGRLRDAERAPGRAA